MINALICQLPAGTEEIYGSNGAVVIPTIEKSREIMFADQMSFMIMGNLRDYDLVQALIGKTILATVKGKQLSLLKETNDKTDTNQSRRTYPYWHGVTITVFKEAIKSEIEQSLQSQYQQISAGNNTIWVTESNTLKRLLYSYIAMPNDHTLISSISKDESLILETLNRSGSKESAIPADLPAWKHVNKLARFWSISYFPTRAENALVDQKFDYCPEAFDTDALAVVANYEPSISEKFQYIYFSKNEDALNLAKQRFVGCPDEEPNKGMAVLLALSSIDKRTVKIELTLPEKTDPSGMNPYLAVGMLAQMLLHDPL